MLRYITLTSHENFSDTDLCVAKYILDNSNFKQLMKQFHPDINEGKATEAFQRLVSLKAYEANSSECKYTSKSNIAVISFSELLTANIYGNVYTAQICPYCNGLGYISKSHVVSKCNKCDNGVIYRKTKTTLLLENGNLVNKTHASVEKDMLTLTHENNTFSLNIKDAIPVDIGNEIALMVIGKNPSCTVEVDGNVFNADCGNVVRLETKHSNIFKLYALIP
jgi:hypothetical protein